MDMPTDAEIRSANAPASAPIVCDGSGLHGPARTAKADQLPRVPASGFAPSLERRRMQIYIAQILADIGIIIASYGAASLLVPLLLPQSAALSDSMLLPLLKIPIFLTISFYSGTYSRPSLVDWRLASLRAVSALLVTSALLAFIGFFANFGGEFSRPEFALGIVSSAVLMVALRIAVHLWVKAIWGPGTLNRLVIEAGGPHVPLPNVYRVNAREHALQPSIDNPAALDRLAQYLRNMDEVLISCPEEDCYAWAEVLKGSGVHCEVVSTYAREIGALGIVHHDECNVAALLVSTGPLAMRDRVLKRGFDIAASGLALFLLAPLLLVCALAIKLEDGGSIFFRQRRMGRGNRFFSIYKFRSMREGQADADGARSASKNDDRITRVGKILRKTSVDELPQLINVLRGEMSLVGPRPHALGSQAGEKLFWQVDRRYWQRHSLRPGITGLAQVRGLRGATNTEEELASRLQADLEYIQGWTIWRDVGVLFSTIRVLVHDRAY